jgi:glycine cleavage system H protein
MIETTIAGLSTLAVIVIGLLARVLLAVLVFAAVAIPLAGLIYAWQGAASVADWLMGVRRLGRVLWRKGCYYTPGHLWLKPARAGLLRVGIDDVAQRVLPDVRAIHLPFEGAAVQAGQAMARVDCEGGAVTLLAPIAGTIRAINRRLARSPHLLHDDPYRRGWLVELTPDDARYEEFAGDGIAPRWLAAEDHRLARFFEHQLGIAAADGGDLILPPHQLLTSDQWEQVRRGFLDAE